MPPLRYVIPAKAGIQYAAASRTKRRSLDYSIARSSRATTAEDAGDDSVRPYPPILATSASEISKLA